MEILTFSDQTTDFWLKKRFPRPYKVIKADMFTMFPIYIYVYVIDCRYTFIVLPDVYLIHMHHQKHASGSEHQRYKSLFSIFSKQEHVKTVSWLVSL